jgi:hypothetical protein
LKLVILQQVLTQVISEMMARNRSHFGAGGPGYYGVQVDDISQDGSKFNLILTFKSGLRYCCMEHGCHIPLYGSNTDAGWFDEVRERLRIAGIKNLPPLAVRKLHVVVEQGAFSGNDPDSSYCYESRLEYSCGPFQEAERPIRQGDGIPGPN